MPDTPTIPPRPCSKCHVTLVVPPNYYCRPCKAEYQRGRYHQLPKTPLGDSFFKAYKAAAAKEARK